MTNSIKFLSLLIGSAALLSACTQTTPSMMNTSPIEMARETVVEQIPVSQINKGVIENLAKHYAENANGPLDLTMTYEPKSRSYTAMKALHQLGHIKKDFKAMGVTNVTTQTLAVPQGKASLMVSYDIVTARGPSDCDVMPGLEHNETGRFIGDYKFGCSVETATARQIADPADLEGNAGLAVRDARRESIVVEGYSSAEPRPPLEGVERGDLAAE